MVTLLSHTRFWGETNPYGMNIQGHSSVSWMTQPQGKNDFAKKEFAMWHFNRSESLSIICCQLYLQVIMAYGLYTYDGKSIHLEIMQKRQVQSRSSHIIWMRNDKPPKSYWIIWDKLIGMIHIRLRQTGIMHFCNAQWHYSNEHTVCTHFGTLHQWRDGQEYHTFLPTQRQ